MHVNDMTDDGVQKMIDRSFTPLLLVTSQQQQEQNIHRKCTKNDVLVIIMAKTSSSPK